MESQYKEALALYNQCEYEKAYDILSNSSINLDDKESRLLEECKKQILQQYRYLINEAEKQKNIGEAKRLKAMYFKKIKGNSLISEPQNEDYLSRNNQIFLLFICAFILMLIIFFIVASS